MMEGCPRAQATDYAHRGCKGRAVMTRYGLKQGRWASVRLLCYGRHGCGRSSGSRGRLFPR